MSIHCNLEPTNGSCITTESQPEGVSMVHFPLTKSTVRESTVRVSNATGGASLQRPSSGNDCLPAGNDDTQTSRRQLIFLDIMPQMCGCRDRATRLPSLRLISWHCRWIVTRRRSSFGDLMCRLVPRVACCTPSSGAKS